MEYLVSSLIPTLSRSFGSKEFLPNSRAQDWSAPSSSPMHRSLLRMPRDAKCMEATVQ